MNDDTTTRDAARDAFNAWYRTHEQECTTAEGDRIAFTAGWSAALAACAGDITCGATHPDPDVETRTQALREAEGHRAGRFGGCDRRLRWTYAYRCVECGRFMHRDCLLEHFKEVADV